MSTKPTDLDHQIYLFFACPECGTTQYVPLEAVVFATDIEIDLDENGTCPAWIETECMACGEGLCKDLGEGGFESDELN